MSDQGWPEYRSHKIVRAAEIVAIDRDKSEILVQLPKEDGYTASIVRVKPEWIAKHPEAQPGGYLVLYSVDYMSWSPAKAFEEGYTRV